jgi:hypothetical protein
MSSLVQAFVGDHRLGGLQRACLELQRHGTPAEVRAAIDLAETLPASVRDWLRRLGDYCFWEDDRLPAFERSMQDERWVFYRGVDNDGTGQRELIVGFTGASGNLFQPVPVVLQQLEPARHDLLVLRDPKRAHFLDGAGEAVTFEALVESIARAARDYASIVTIGASSGAFPALVVAAALGARRGIGLGGRPPSDAVTAARLLAATRRDGEDDPDPSVGRALGTSLLAVFGSDFGYDRRGAEGIRSLLPAVRRIAIDGAGTHNVPHVAFQTGSLSSLYGMLLAVEDPLTAPGVNLLGESDGVATIRLTATCTAPAWAAPERSPEFWVANTFTVPPWLHRRLRRIPFPDRIAITLESLARRRFGVLVNLRRLGTPASRARSARESED